MRSEVVGERIMRGEPVEPVVVNRTEEESHRLVSEFLKFDPKSGNLAEFMEFVCGEKWRFEE